MIYVLVVITVFTTTAGVGTETRFQEFAGREACESARQDIEQGLAQMKGTMGREWFTACYPKG